MPRPRKIDYPTYWSWRQADKAWLRRHGRRCGIAAFIEALAFAYDIRPHRTWGLVIVA
jgi:hypothetical protein